MPFIFVGKNENKQNNDGPWWKPGMQIFSEISTWIAVPIILALIVGKFLDTRYGTKPLLLLISAGAAFLISAYGIVKSVKNFTNKIQPPKSPLSGGLHGSSSPDKGRTEEGLGQK